jgi:competence protein ComEC
MVLIDAGPRNVVLEWCLDQGIVKIDCVVITHADDDHLRGLVALMDDDSISIGEVRYNGNAAQASAVWDAVLFAIEDRHRRGDMIVQPAVVTGDHLFSVGDGFVARAVAPSVRVQGHGVGWLDEDGQRAGTNTLSIVIHVSCRDEDFALLASDLDAMGLKHMLGQRNVTISAPTLVWPHHGGNVKSGASESNNVAYALALAAAVNPKTVVISNGRARKNFPRAEIVNAVRRDRGRLLRWCCTQLATACAETLPTDDDAHLDDAFAAGRQAGSCCAGSISVWPKGRVLPARQSYEAFKIRSAPTAVCRRPLV